MSHLWHGLLLSTRLLPGRPVAGLEWLRCSGRGTVYTFTITRQNQSAGFRNKVPYVMTYVELEEGVRLLTNIVDCDPDSVAIGMPVEVTFEDVTPEVSVPLFKPAS